VRCAAEFGDFLFERGAFSAEDELLRLENLFDGRSNLGPNCRVLRREIELWHRIEQGSGLWVRGHQLFTCQ
jgi:hypothetical protein